MQSGSFVFEEEAFKASGLCDSEAIAVYVNKLEGLRHDLVRQITCDPDPGCRAEAIFRLLWRLNPLRYRPGASFRFNHVIDAQSRNEIGPIGNCLGLTILYHSLLRRIEVDSGAFFLENGFGLGPHVLSFIKTNSRIIQVENILPNGFGYEGHLEDAEAVRWGERELVADIYHSAANELFEKGRFEEALENYKRALDLNPEYERAQLNMRIVIDKMEAGK